MIYQVRLFPYSPTDADLTITGCDLSGQTHIVGLYMTVHSFGCSAPCRCHQGRGLISAVPQCLEDTQASCRSSYPHVAPHATSLSRWQTMRRKLDFGDSNPTRGGRTAATSSGCQSICLLTPIICQLENARAAMDLYRSHATEWEDVISKGQWPSHLPPDTFARCYL